MIDLLDDDDSAELVEPLMDLAVRDIVDRTGWELCHVRRCMDLVGYEVVSNLIDEHEMDHDDRRVMVTNAGKKRRQEAHRVLRLLVDEARKVEKKTRKKNLRLGMREETS